MDKTKNLSIAKIIAIVLLVAVLFGVSFSLFSGLKNGTVGDTNAYLKKDGVFMGVVQIGGHQLEVKQGENDCTSESINLETETLATDKPYTFTGVQLYNADNPNGLFCYVRWKFTATIDGKENININKYCKTRSNNATLDDNEEWFYYTNESFTPLSLAGGTAISIIDLLEFDGEYNATTGEYGSILDEYYSGSTFKLDLVVEASETPWSFVKPTAKIYADGALIAESSNFTSESTLPDIPDNLKTIIKDGKNYYFQYYTRNGSGIYNPGETVTYDRNDEFEAVYSTTEGLASSATLVYEVVEGGLY